jgi:hypothetical protein
VESVSASGKKTDEKEKGKVEFEMSVVYLFV